MLLQKREQRLIIKQRIYSFVLEKQCLKQADLYIAIQFIVYNYQNIAITVPKHNTKQINNNYRKIKNEKC